MIWKKFSRPAPTALFEKHGMSDRRRFMALGGAALLARFLGNPGVAWASERKLNAFDARSPESVYAALGLSAPVESTEIIIQVPDIAENGAQVPVEVTVRLPRVQRILLIGELNLFPLLADIRLGERSQAWFEAKVKLAESSRIRVIAQADGRLYTTSRPVRVIVGGCLPG
jgi:sulfur-oxidizing protein SoxY